MIASIFASALFIFTGLHPIHVAVTQIDHSKDDKALQVTHKLFVDDFENTLKEIYGKSISIGLEEEHEKCDEYIQAYLTAYFKMTVNGKSVAGNWVGKELEGAAVWIYMEYPDIKRIKSIQLENRILFETFNDQKNLVHFKYNGIKRSLALEKDEASGEVTFK